MTEQEMISALQTVLKPIESVRLDVKSAERRLSKEIRDLQDGQETLIAVLEAKGILSKVVE